jgi:hypothetical protein
MVCDKIKKFQQRLNDVNGGAAKLNSILDSKSSLPSKPFAFKVAQ